MSGSSIVNRPVFRLLVPFFVGVIAYYLILLGFDSISRLKENFFGVEVVLCVVISGGLLELLRIGLFVVTRRVEGYGLIIWKIVLIVIVSAALISLLFVSIVISVYYSYLVGFSSFKTELIVFNAIYLFIAVAYSTFFISTVYLNKTNSLAISREIDLQASIEKQLNSYKSQINPAFLYASLERIIVLLHGSSNEAASATQTLSQVYRHVLTAKTTDLVSVASELDQFAILVQLLNGTTESRIVASISSIDNLPQHLCMVPSTLHAIALYLVSQFVTESAQPLDVKMFAQGDTFFVEAKGIRRLLPLDFSTNDFDVLNRAYGYFVNSPISLSNNGNSTSISVKLIAVDDE